MASIIEQQGNRLTIRGSVTVDTVTDLLAEGLSKFSGEMVVDLAGVDEVDSSAISLLFEWLRQAKARNATVFYSNLPPTLISLATLYGVLDLIPQH